MPLSGTGALLCLERIPPIESRLGRRCALLRLRIVQAAIILKYVRVTPQQLLDDDAERIVDGEQPALRSNLREKDTFENVVADLLAQRVCVAALDRVDHLVRLFEHVMRK